MLARFKQGLMVNDPTVKYAAYRALHDAGPVVIPTLIQTLQGINLKDVEHVQVVSVVTGVATLLHDLSETESLAFIDDALNQECNPSIASALRNIKRFSTKNFRQAFFGDLEILEDKTLDESIRATHHICGWLGNVPEDDLSGIQRLYIIAQEPHHDFYGHILPHLAVITVAWDTTFFPKGPLGWISRMEAEMTLYHEIGHHVHRHKEYGQVPEQEDEANAYMSRRMREAHPVIAGLVRLFKRKPSV